MKEVKLLLGDCLDKLKELETNSVDSVVTDPPYHLTSIVKRFGKENSAPAQFGTDGAYARAAKGFMGKQWDGGDIAFRTEVWSECLRVLKPGGYILAFGGTRTYHRMTVAIEDAGFEIRDCIAWMYGSGFPKSHNIGKAIDKRGGNNHLVSEVAEKLKLARESRGISKTEADKLFCNGTTNYQWFEGRKDGVRLPDDVTFEKICEEWIELKSYQSQIKSANREVIGNYDSDMGGLGGERLGNKGGDITIASTDEAKKWEGWGTALKPAFEPVVMGRKPLEQKTVAENVLEWGTGGINIDDCRIGNEKIKSPQHGKNTFNGDYPIEYDGEYKINEGRFPANVILGCTCEKVIEGDKGEIKYSSGSRDNVNLTHEWGYNDIQRTNYTDTGNIHTDPNCPCYILDKQSGTTKGGKNMPPYQSPIDNPVRMNSSKQINRIGYEDTGGASRFFYCPKTSKSDRNEGCDELEKKTSAWMSPDSRTNKEIYDRTSPGLERFKPLPRANNHPTVKPTDLMRYLVRLITPKGGTVLDPFMGSGSTGKAAVLEGMNFVGIERETEYYEIAQNRITAVNKEQHHERFFEFFE